MGKKLIIAEKPSVARDIAKVLKVTNKGDGYFYNDTYVVSWAVGHLVTLSDPEDYDVALKKWRIETLPIIPEKISLKPIPNTKSQLAILKKLMNAKETDSIICATDSGREGELIFRYIYDIVKCKKPFERLWISSMTDQAISEGFQCLKSGTEYDNLFYSAKCRSEADWLVGINGSRAYTIKYNALLSIGRVQTPTLALIVERQKEINAFVPSDYYEIKVFYDGFSGLYFLDKYTETKIIDEEKAKEIFSAIENGKGKVSEVTTEEKSRLSPLLFDLTELQRVCNRKFGFSATKTLNIAQDLYEKRKLITYPRTDSRYLSTDMVPKLKNILSKLQTVQSYKEYAETLLNKPKLNITKRIVDDTKISDHHAIIPTEVKPSTTSLSSDEFKVYDQIAKRFMAIFYPPYRYNSTRVITNINEHTFISKGILVLDMGYMELYTDDKEDNEEEGGVLPALSEGDIYDVLDRKLEKKKTKPPKAYTEATLLSAMENCGRLIDDQELKEQMKESGLGTPATRAATIERLLTVGYIERKGKNVIPTEKGMSLIEIVPNELKSAETTGKWERALSLIAKGKMDSDKFMGSIKRYVYYIIDESKKGNKDVQFKAEPTKIKGKIKSLGKCPKCNGEVLENSKGFYCTNWKSGCKFTIWKNALNEYGKEIDASFIKALLKDGKVTAFHYISPQSKQECVADIVLDEKTKTILSFIDIKHV